MIGVKGPSNFYAWRPNFNTKVATVLGGVYMLDELFANAGTVTNEDSFDNVIAAATSGLFVNAMFVAEGVYAGSTRGTFTAYGPCKALVSGTVAKGDKLIPTNAQAYMTASAGSGGIAIAHGTSSGGTALIDVKFVGGWGFRLP